MMYIWRWLSLVKRIGTGALLLALSALPAAAQTSVFAQVNVAGSFNGFETLNSNMVRVADNLWQADLTITNRSFFFKFATPNFAQNWGLNNQPNRTLPLAMTGQSGAGDIQITNPLHTVVSGGTTNLNVQYRFLFNDATREFAVFLINNLSATNLLYNGGFETAGSQATRAFYWEQGNPNVHGLMAGSTDRRDWNLGNNTSVWVGLVKGRWANQGPSGTWWQEAPVEPGVSYEGAAFFQPEGAPNLFTAAVKQLRLEYYDFNRTNLLATFTRDLSGIPPVPNLSETMAVSNNIWAQQFVSGPAPAGAAWGRLVVFVDGVGPNGTFRIDDASLRATVPKRTEDFNDWAGTSLDSTYTRGGWTVSTGRTVSAYTNGASVITLARSGLAASLTNPGASNTGSYVQSPRFDDGVGTITFYYRHGYQGNPTNNPEAPVSFKVQRSQLGDFWVTIADVSNVISTTFQRFDVFNADVNAKYVRIVHSGGSTNRLIIDDIFVDSASSQPRLMTFNSWTNATTSSNHFHLGWRLSNGLVSAAFALDGLAGQITGTNTSANYLLSPTFNNGYGTIRFNYRLGGSSTRTAGFSLEASSNGTSWVVLDTVTNIAAASWQDYSRFFIQTTPHALRIRNLAETNIAFATTLEENFVTAPAEPSGWNFTQIGVYPSNGDPAPSLRFDATGANITTPPLINATQLVFWIRGQSISPENYLTVEGVLNGAWSLLQTYSSIPNSDTTYTLRLTNSPSQLRFTYYKVAGGNLALDRVRVFGSPMTNPPPQALVLENVDIGNPVEFRTQNFDSWPTKTNYTTGTTFHQGWTATGPVIVTSTKAFSGQAITMTRAASDSGNSSEYAVGFENAGETKTSYTSNNVSLSGLNWSLTDVLIGTSASDWKNGIRSARMRGYATSILQMIEDRPGGLSNLRFNYSRYGTDAQTAWRVQYSTNSGATWLQIGSNITADASVKTFSVTTNIPGNIRIRVIPTNTTGTADRRMNIDDIVLTSTNVNSGSSVANSAITSHFMPGGVGPVSFYYRHGGDATAIGSSIMNAAIQTSSNGITWITTGTVSIATTNYTLHEHYVSLTNHFYARIAITNGTGTAILDEITVARPQPPANALVNGYYEPATPFTNDAVTLFASISPQYGARNFAVTSYYRIGTSGAFTAIAMAPLGGNVFQATSAIPKQARGTIVQFYIQAYYDGPGNQLTEPATYPLLAPPAGTNVAFYAIPRNAPGKVWINEIDYVAPYLDDFDTDSDEFVELAGYAGTDLTGWRVDLLDGNNAVFASYPITNTFVIANEINGFGFFVLGRQFLVNPVPDLIMNSTNYMELFRPGVVRLHNELGGIEDQVAYGGDVFGQDNIGEIDYDVNYEPFDFISTSSVSRVGIGFTSSEFGWDGSPSNKTPGAVNQGQTFASAPVIVVFTNQLTFSYIAGSLNPAAQFLVVSNAGGSTLSYSVVPNVGWLTVSPATTNLAPGAVAVHAVQPETTGLTGNRFAALAIEGVAANSPVSVDVSLQEITLGAALVHYDFDEGAGSTVINVGSSGTNANATIVNGQRTLEAQGVSASLNDFAYISPAPTARVQTAIAVTNLNNLSRFTLTGWLRPNTLTGGVHRILGNRQTGRGFDLYTTADYANLSLVSATGGSPAAVTSDNLPLANQQWTFFAVTFDSTDSSTGAVTFYRGAVNASAFAVSSASTGTLGATGISTGRLFVGGTGTNAFEGWIDDVRVFGSELDPMTIEAVRRAGAIRGTGSGEPPIIETEPQGEDVPAGTPVSFFVDASGVPAPQYQWRKFGLALPGQISPTLNIPTPTLADAGSYDVVVFNAYGSVTSVTVILSIQGGGLFFVSQPLSQTVHEGENVTFNGTASSSNTVTYQWSRSGTNISLATNSTLVLTNVQVAQQGNYRVVAADGSAAITSLVATLTVVPMDFEGDLGTDVISRPANAAGVVIRWPSISNRVYDVLWSTNLLAGTQGFTPVATNLPATPSINTYTDSVHNLELRGVYRIRSKTP